MYYFYIIKSELNF